MKWLKETALRQGGDLGNSFYDLTHGQNRAWRNIIPSLAAGGHCAPDRPARPADPKAVKEIGAEIAQISAELARLEPFYPASGYVLVLKAKVARLRTNYAIE